MLVQVQNLKTSFTVEKRKMYAVDDVSFSIPKGKTVGLVGESGCGKSVTALSLMGLVPQPGKVESGQILYNEQNVLHYTQQQWQQIRGKNISMIFQEPMTALNPVFTIGNQVSEVFVQHQNVDTKTAWEKSIQALDSVGIPSAKHRANEYPHQLSGGMRQRVMIAMALACKPDLLIADEPTTALDVTIQDQILDLMRSLQEQLHTSILFITHDLGVVAQMCHEVMVMYAGKIVESSGVMDIFKRPKHPYTKGLLQSKVTLRQDRSKPLNTIKGLVPSLFNLPQGCSYQDRCPKVVNHCRQQTPTLENVNPTQKVACFEAET
ncbi:MAG: ABC transporter ATP-binding protein [Myxococcota bacterium]